MLFLSKEALLFLSAIHNPHTLDSRHVESERSDDCADDHDHQHDNNHRPEQLPPLPVALAIRQYEVMENQM
jgi:hypothetical protein